MGGVDGAAVQLGHDTGGGGSDRGDLVAGHPDRGVVATQGGGHCTEQAARLPEHRPAQIALYADRLVRLGAHRLQHGVAERTGEAAGEDDRARLVGQGNDRHQVQQRLVDLVDEPAEPVGFGEDLVGLPSR